MIISPIVPIMSAYRLEGGRLAHKGNVINFKQDVVQLARSLPRRVGELPVVIVRRRNSRSPNTFSEFRVRREAIRKWLEVLFAENPSFLALLDGEELSWDELSLESLPEDANVADQLKTMFEDEEESVGTNDVPSNDGSGGESPDDSPAEDEPRNAGPEQGSTCDLYVDDVEQQGVTRSNTAVQETQDEIVRQALKDHVNAETNEADGGDCNSCDGNGGNGKGDEDVSIPWPKQGSEPVNEWATPFLMSLCFPTLFPFGAGDVTNPDRHHEISFSKAVTHYQKYCIIRDGKPEWPCSDHPRWPHWARNVEERHRAVSQRSIYLELHPEDAQMTMEQLTKIVREGGAALKALTGRMQALNANMLGLTTFSHSDNGGKIGLNPMHLSY